MATIKIVLRDKPNREGLYPIVFKITKERKTKIITLGIDCLKKDWDEKSSQFKKSYPNYLQRNRVLLNFKQKALTIIDGFNLEEIDFTLNQFEEKLRGKEQSKITVLEFWLEKINDLNLAGRTGSARAHQDTKNSFFKFHKNQKVLFREVTVEVLDKYETHLRANGSNDGGIGVRMRELRALYNEAIRRGVVLEKYYPFKVYKVSKLKGKGFKKALTRDEVKKIENLDENKYPHLLEAKYLFVFSYYTRGMNFYDMMKLTWDNIDNDKIIYTRSKTKGKFIVKILEPVQEILNFYKTVNTLTGYVFPILLKEGLTPIQIEYRKFKKLKQFNSDLKKIAEIVGIDKPVTSYVARHSFATNLKELGISTDIISQSMGHHNVSITTAYLKDFDNNIIDDANEKLLQEPISIYTTRNDIRFSA
ncbi:site-specific integrase [Flavobacterium acetivorans]|uniref:site-specific integrase n=1 Tax=Flavobacterium acetivorans TaxID=2893883 RepID=UPI001E51E89B|nr:site-specific integrase [Flavobacterium sp. F-29]UFH36071.1 site-specific integrase [Flavobacterium sp. F-29]